jgi:sialate O-acetylesterase
MEASAGGRLEIFCGGAPACSFEGVAVGEVWIAGGQSNMEFTLKYDRGRRKVFARPPDPLLRFFEVPKLAWEGQREAAPFVMGDFAAQGRWLGFSRETAPLFSAAAWYFAARLRESLGADVPVGIVGCTWSGSPAFAWIAEESLRADGELARFLTEYDGRVKTLESGAYEAAHARAQAEGRSPVMRAAFDLYMRGRIPILLGDLVRKINPGFFELQLAGPRDPWRPCGLYATMLRTVAGYTCRGVIWYQGEGDDVRAESYTRLFTLLVRCWRQDWGDELPFIFVQLAAFERDHFQSGDSFPELRSRQEEAARTVSHAWMVCAMDLGERFNIHPGRKGPVGERLAAAAAARVYGLDAPWRSPLAEGLSCEEREGVHSLTVRFSGCDGGLVVRGRRLRGLRIFAGGTELRKFSARPEADSLVITPDQRGGAAADEVRYAWEPYTRVNLFNGAGFPALPFRLSL